MIYVYRIYEFIFSIIILFYYCFSGTPLLNVTPPLHDPVEDLRTKMDPQSEQKPPEVPVGEEQLEIRRVYDVLLCLSDRHYSIKDIPSSIFSFLPQTFFFVSRSLSPVITITLIISKLCSTVDCVFFDDVDGAVCCSMYVPCLWIGVLSLRRNSCWVEKKKNKVL